MTTCGGGLYAHRFGRGNGFDNPSVYCADLARLIVGIRYRRRAAADVARRTGVRIAVRDAGRHCRRRDLAAPDVVDGLVRREHEVDRELMFTVATMAGKDHGRPAWQLLVDVEAASPETVVSTLGYPYVRLRVRDALAAAQPDGATACRDVLAAVAMAAAIRAGASARASTSRWSTASSACPGWACSRCRRHRWPRSAARLRPGEFAVRPDVGRVVDVHRRPVGAVAAGPGRGHRRIGPAVRRRRSRPLAAYRPPRGGTGCRPASRTARVAMLGRRGRPAFVAATPIVRGDGAGLRSQKTPTAVAPEAVFGAVAIPMAEPAATAVALAGHAARSVYQSPMPTRSSPRSASGSITVDASPIDVRPSRSSSTDGSSLVTSRSSGFRRNGTYLVHSSLRRVGTLPDGPVTLAEGAARHLRSRSPRSSCRPSPRATPRPPVRTVDAPPDMSARTAPRRGGEDRRVRSGRPPRRRTSESFSEYVRNASGSFRSNHPQTSFCAVGPTRERAGRRARPRVPSGREEPVELALRRRRRGPVDRRRVRRVHLLPPRRVPARQARLDRASTAPSS